MSVASARKSDMAGGWRLLQLSRDDSKAGHSWDHLLESLGVSSPCDWGFLRHDGLKIGQCLTYRSGFESQYSSDTRQKLHDVQCASLRSHADSVELHVPGQSSHSLSWLKVRRQKVYLNHIRVLECMTLWIGRVSMHLHTCFNTSRLLFLNRRETHILLNIYAMDYSFDSKSNLKKYIHVVHISACLISFLYCYHYGIQYFFLPLVMYWVLWT